MTHLRPLTALLLPALVAFAGTARAQIVERLDVSTSGTFGDVAADRVVVSDDGQVAAFLSRAGNLVLPDDATSTDVFVRHRATGTTQRLATDVRQDLWLELSGDGRWVVWSVAIPGPPQFTQQTFVHDLMTGTTTQVATSFGDVVPGSITPDGRFLLVYGRSTAVPFLPFGAWRLDLQTGTLLIASRDMQGMPSVATPERGGISADGEVLVFSSLSSTLVAGDTNSESDVFLFRASTGVVERISVDNVGTGGNQESIRPTLSADGTLVAFMSKSTNLDPADTNLFFDVYLRDVAQGTTRRSSAPLAGGAANGPSENPRISGNGRYVAFDSTATNLTATAGDGPTTLDVFVLDLASEVMRSATPGSPFDGQHSQVGSISADGRWLGLRSTFSSLPDAGSTGGAYLADFGPGCSAQSYCAALPNSTGVAAAIGSQGDASRLLNNFTLSVLDMPPNAIAIFASGTAPIDPGVPFGNGLRCIGGSMVRHGVLHANSGVVIDHQDLTSPAYAGVQPGDVRYYQCIYRDPAGGGAAFNTTDALAVTFCY